jgi:predicted metal-binding membrane protein
LEAAPRGPLQAAGTAIVALVALIPALTRKNKSRRAKIQLTFGLFVTGLLIVWAAYLVIAAIGTLITTATGGTPTGFWSLILTPGPKVVLFGGLLTGTVYVVSTFSLMTRPAAG